MAPQAQPPSRWSEVVGMAAVYRGIWLKRAFLLERMIWRKVTGLSRRLSMQTVPLGPGFAAELRGVTIQQVAADDTAYKDVRAAFEEHSVLVFRAQHVDNNSQLAFSR